MIRKKTTWLLSVLWVSALMAGCGVKQTKDFITVEAGQKMALAAKDFFDIDQHRAKDITFDMSKVDTDVVGEYEVSAAYKKENYTIRVAVEDTAPPQVEMKQRYIITREITEHTGWDMIESIYDASGYTVAFSGFEKTADLSILDEASVKALTDGIPIPGNQEELAVLGKKDLPSEEGIYRAALAVTDEFGHVQREEVYVILDRTGARIADVPDKILEVEAEEVDKKPEVDPADYTVTDNVDGEIKAEDICCELELVDETSHKYVVHVSYTDRAGNESKADFVIQVTGKKKEGPKQEQESRPEQEPDTGADTGGGSTETVSESVHVPVDEASGEVAELTKAQQGAVNAGYHNIVSDGNGGYCVMVHEGEYGYGMQLLTDFLEAAGCEPYNGDGNKGGAWIDIEKDQYMVHLGAGCIRPIDTSGKEW